MGGDHERNRGRRRNPGSLPASGLTVDEAWARERLGAIAAPTLLLWGADDRVIPKRLIDEIRVAHPDWASRTIAGVGHLLPWEAPDLYVELAG